VGFIYTSAVVCTDFKTILFAKETVVHKTSYFFHTSALVPFYDFNPGYPAQVDFRFCTRSGKPDSAQHFTYLFVNCFAPFLWAIVAENWD
jgi:hypothetical protein